MQFMEILVFVLFWHQEENKASLLPLVISLHLGTVNFEVEDVE